MEKFSDFISEQKNEQPYHLVALVYDAHNVRDVADNQDKGGDKDEKLIVKSAKKLNLKYNKADFSGLYSTKTSDGRTITTFKVDENGRTILPDTKDKILPYDKPFSINPKNTIILPRGLGTIGFTGSRNWFDLIQQFELEGYYVINSNECYNICTSKLLTDMYLKNAGVRTPKTYAIPHSEAVEDTVKRLGLKFPVILKSSTGTQTGVGVVVAESMRSLNSLVQMILLYERYLPLIVQEYIETEYDIRVIVCNNEVIGAMKRDVIKSDVRSNVSLGADASEIELTELEVQESLKAAKAVKGILVGVDLIPSKNRETEKPFCIEVNANLGFGGVERVIKSKSITETILKTFLNRDNWRKQ